MINQRRFLVYTRVCARCGGFFQTKRRLSRGTSSVCFECAINKWRSLALPQREVPT